MMPFFRSSIHVIFEGTNHSPTGCRRSFPIQNPWGNLNENDLHLVDFPTAMIGTAEEQQPIENATNRFVDELQPGTGKAIHLWIFYG